jgi:hypothetical protein
MRHSVSIMLSRRRFLTTCGASALLPQALFAESKEASLKKGWAGGDASMIQTFGAHWYYNWGPDGKNSTAKEFVPMIKSERDFSRFGKVEGMSGISHLLGYNEPERKDQGNLTLEKALEAWPKLLALADKKSLRLGSPAPSSDGQGMKWLDEFMKEAKRRKLRVDFIAVHWYRSRDAGAFEGFVKELARNHRLPVWITEFNGWSGPERENHDFLQKTLRFLERSKDVERYAYFEPGKGKEHSLMKEDGSLTRMGELYKAAGT